MQKLQSEMDRASDIKPENLNLVYFPNPKLSAKSNPVLESIPDSANLQNFIKSMFVTMEMNRGIGLSAIQVGVPLSLFVLKIEGKTLTVINPVILKSEGKTFEPEGCLSIPFVTARVVRASTIEVSFFNEKGELCRQVLEGLWAKAFQHEFDHLQGVTMYDQLDSLSQKSMMKKVKKVHKVLGF